MATGTDSLDCHDCMLYGGIRVVRGFDSIQVASRVASGTDRLSGGVIVATGIDRLSGGVSG